MHSLTPHYHIIPHSHHILHGDDVHNLTPHHHIIPHSHDVFHGDDVSTPGNLRQWLEEVPHHELQPAVWGLRRQVVDHLLAVQADSQWQACSKMGWRHHWYQYVNQYITWY